jgi:hypothetical protein
MSKLVVLFFFMSGANAHEYDTRERESYQQQQHQNATSAMARMQQTGLTFKKVILSFATKHGGLADSGECFVGTNYSCDGSLCTPQGTATVSVNQLGSFAGATFNCKVQTRDNLACLIESGTYRSGFILKAICRDSQRQQRVFKLL